MIAAWLTLLIGSDGSTISAPSDRSVAWLAARPAADGRDASGSLQALIRTLIDDGEPAAAATSPAEREELRRLYQPDGAPLWLDADGRPTASLRDAVTVFRDAANEGLDPADYGAEDVAHLLADLEAGSLAAADLARLEVAASAGMLRYLRHLHIGRVDPRAIGFRLDTPRDQHDFAAVLRRAVSTRGVMALVEGLRPPILQYDQLRGMLPRYRTLAADSTIIVPPIAQTVRRGDPFAGRTALCRQLVAFGDLGSPACDPAASGQFDDALVEGVKRFQVRHGLDTDGVLGTRTIAALQVPLEWRVRQIELALERLRWLPHLTDGRLIALNIPMLRFWAWDLRPPGSPPRFGMDAIVGRALRTQTPVFVEQMREVIIRPYWNVPPSILRREVLPAIARDPDYLRREEMEIVRGDGDGAPRVDLTADALAGLRQGLLRVRQRPGAKNALGLIKFVFPNREDVYMHGTPAQALFARRRRDFSHGCVRVADPVALAEWVLQDRPEWTRDRIVGATAGTQTIRVTLPRPIQVMLFYTTAAVMPEDGAIHFAEDIYRHDVRLDRALSSWQASRRPR